FPWNTAHRFLLRDRDASYGSFFSKRVAAMGITEVVTAPRSPWQNAYVRARDRFDTSRMSRPHSDLQRAPSAPRPVLVRRLLPKHPHASVALQGLSALASHTAAAARPSHRHPARRMNRRAPQPVL